VHTREKPHKCDICDKSCAKADNLKIHKLVHTEEIFVISPLRRLVISKSTSWCTQERSPTRAIFVISHLRWLLISRDTSASAILHFLKAFSEPHCNIVQHIVYLFTLVALKAFAVIILLHHVQLLQRALQSTISTTSTETNRLDPLSPAGRPTRPRGR
jgi:hypothetical protein